jgi:hypothetical protein
LSSVLVWETFGFELGVSVFVPPVSPLKSARTAGVKFVAGGVTTYWPGPVAGPVTVVPAGPCVPSLSVVWMLEALASNGMPESVANAVAEPWIVMLNVPAVAPVVSMVYDAGELQYWRLVAS